MTAYTVGNLQTDAVSLANSVKDALTSNNSAAVEAAWVNAIATSAKIVGGMAELTANNPSWAGTVGSGATLASIGISANNIKTTAQSGQGLGAIKVSDVLGIIGGISDLGGNFLLKPGPVAVAGATLKGIGLGAGIAQVTVGDLTFGQMLSTTPTSTPIVDSGLFSASTYDGQYAPDGTTPLYTGVTTYTSNTQTDTIWTRLNDGSYVQSTSITIKNSQGVVQSTNFIQSFFDSDGIPVSANSYVYNSAGVLQSSQALVPGAGGQGWVNAPTGTSAPTIGSPQSYFSSNGANSHSVTASAGASLGQLLIAQNAAGNNITMADLQASNPSLAGANLAANQTVYIPQKQPDGSVTYHYANGATVNSNSITGEYHMITDNASGGQTIYSRTVDGDAGYTIHQISTDGFGNVTYEYSGFQDTLDSTTHMYLNQYNVNGAEIATLQFVDSFGHNWGEYGMVSGAMTGQLGVSGQVISVSGYSGNPLLSGGLVPIDLSGATLTSHADIQLSSASWASALDFATQGSSFSGNTLDFALDVGDAAGLYRYGVGSHPESFGIEAMGGWPATFDSNLKVDGIPYYLSTGTPTELMYYAAFRSYSLGNSFGSLWYDDGLVMVVDLINWYSNSVFGGTNEQSELDDFYEEFINAGGSPIVIDLNGDGIQTISLANSSVRFDVTGDDLAERTAWLSPNDGFLVRDLNSDGKINGVNEMFGGMQRGEGYAELAALDSNNDGLISSLDAEFTSLGVWRDLNSNGVTDDGELFSLDQLHITELALNYTSQEVRNQGNLLGEVSTATINGQSASMGDVYFKYLDNTLADDGTYAGRLLRPADAAVNAHVSQLVQAMAAFSPPSAAINSVASVSSALTVDQQLAVNAY